MFLNRSERSGRWFVEKHSNWSKKTDGKLSYPLDTNTPCSVYCKSIGLTAQSIWQRRKMAPLESCRVSALVILRTFLEEIWTVARIQMWPSPPHGKLRPGPLNTDFSNVNQPAPAWCLKEGGKTKKLKGTHKIIQLCTNYIENTIPRAA